MLSGNLEQKLCQDLAVLNHKRYYRYFIALNHSVESCCLSNLLVITFYSYILPMITRSCTWLKGVAKEIIFASNLDLSVFLFQLKTDSFRVKTVLNLLLRLYYHMYYYTHI